MTILKCLIVDDEPLAHTVIQEYARDIPFLEITGQCYTAIEALSFLKTHVIDLIFLDIRMPKVSGLDLLRTLQQKPIVIICSAFQEHAIETYDLEVCDYLLKPFRFDRFLKAVNRALSLHHLHRPAEKDTKLASTPNIRQITIKADRRMIVLDLDDIFYLESFGNYVKLWTGEKFLLTPRTMASFALQLPVTDFIRAHKSFIINIKQFHYLEGNLLFLKNGKQIPVGKNFRKAIQGKISSTR